MFAEYPDNTPLVFKLIEYDAIDPNDSLEITPDEINEGVVVDNKATFDLTLPEGLYDPEKDHDNMLLFEVKAVIDGKKYLKEFPSDSDNKNPDKITGIIKV